MNIKKWFTRPILSGDEGQKKKTAPGIKLLIAVVILAALIYAVFAPSSLVMANGYMLYPADSGNNVCMLKEPGGRVLIQGNLYFTGTYPWLAGWKGKDGVPAFILNLETCSFSLVPQDMTAGEFTRFCEEHDYAFSSALSWNDLYPEKDPAQSKSRRAAFKSGLQKKKR